MLSFLRQFIDLTDNSNSSTFLNKFLLNSGSLDTYYTGASTCNAGSNALLVSNILDGQDNLSDQDFQFCINASGSNYTIKAKNPKTGCEISLNQTLKVSRNSSC